MGARLKRKQAQVQMQTDKRFEKINVFEVVVPENFKHESCLDTFSREHSQELHRFDADITDEHYSHVTTKLVPGRKFEVTVFQIKDMNRMSFEDCLSFLRSQQAVLVGAQGAMLAYEQGRDELPDGRSLSFDEMEALWKDAKGYRPVPTLVSHYSNYSEDTTFGFTLYCRRACFGPGNGYHILCFRELEA